MELTYDPGALQAVLKDRGGHWCLDIEVATGGSWGHADTTWSSTTSATTSCATTSVSCGGRCTGSHRLCRGGLRRAGWRAVRSGDPAAAPSVETWELSPATSTAEGRPAAGARGARSSSANPGAPMGREARPWLPLVLWAPMQRRSASSFWGPWHSSGRSFRQTVAGISDEQAPPAHDGERPVPRGTDQARGGQRALLDGLHRPRPSAPGPADPASVASHEASFTMLPDDTLAASSVAMTTSPAAPRTWSAHSTPSTSPTRFPRRRGSNRGHGGPPVRCSCTSSPRPPSTPVMPTSSAEALDGAKSHGVNGSDDQLTGTASMKSTIERRGERRVVDRAQVISGEDLCGRPGDPGSERIGWAVRGCRRRRREHHGGHGDPIQGGGSPSGHAGWRQVPSGSAPGGVGERPETPGARFTDGAGSQLRVRRRSPNCSPVVGRAQAVRPHRRG